MAVRLCIPSQETSHMRALTLLALLALPGLMPPASPAAPAPDPEPSPAAGAPVAIDRYLPDDSHFVLNVDVKAILGSTLFTRHFKKDVEGLLARPDVARVLQEAGVNALRDIDQLVVSTGKSCFPEEVRQQGAVLLVRGRFNEAKVRAALAARGKTISIGKAKVYVLVESGPGFSAHVAVLDRNTLMLAPTRALLSEGLDKAANKRKTKLAVKELATALKRFKPGQAVQCAGVEEMVIGGSVSSTSDASGKTTTTVKQVKLGESGFKAIHLGVTVKDKVKGTMTFTLKDATGLVKMLDLFKDYQKKVTDGLNDKAQRDLALAPLVKAYRSATIKAVKDRITFELEADAETIKAFVKMSGLARMLGPGGP
jgi:hypothetical protein